MADINIHADGPQRKNLKYMQQLVRAYNCLWAHPLIAVVATSGEQGSGDVGC